MTGIEALYMRLDLVQDDLLTIDTGNGELA